ncbi:MAG TPA: two-component regulator propeller domain-containing protein [Bryobacteraceae bacterium]|nr:two-component regulator propeller domain-containing protein [Bryobacteraceae bacterium]
MIDFNSFLNRLATALALGCLVPAALALDPNRDISQYIHDRWGAEQGFPGGVVYAIAQTADGYLWIGAENGLVRFDGLSFRLYNHANTPELPAGPVLGLTADREGNLWIKVESQGLLRYRSGAFQAELQNSSGPPTVVTAMALTKSGELLVSRSNGLLRSMGGKLVGLASPLEWKNLLVISMAETGDGKLWMGTRDAGLFYLSNGRVSRVTSGLPDQKVNSLLAAGDRDLWVGTDAGLVRWNGAELTREGTPRSLEHAQIMTLAKDRDSNIWVASAQGISRITPAGVASAARNGPPPGGEVVALLEDHEGSLWIGNSRGIERFRDTLFLSYDPAGLSRSENYGPLYADATGHTWFAPSRGGLFRLQGEKAEKIAADGLASDVVYAISGANDDLWVARQQGGLTHLHLEGATIAAHTYAARDGLPRDTVYTVHRNRDGAVWAGTLHAGATRFQNGKFTTYTTANGLASNTVSAIEEGSDGAMWFATPNGVSEFNQDRWKVYTGREGLPPGGVNCLLADSTGVLWIGTASGIAFLNNGRIQAPANVPGSLREPVFGIAEDSSRRLWITTSNRVLRVNRDSLILGAARDADIREFGIDDGLRGGGGVNRSRSVVRDPLGRIWLSLQGGIFVVDPTRSTGSSAPAPIYLQSASADGTMLDLRGPLKIPAERRRITFSFIGLSLSTPDRIRYRYMLEGFDRDWSEPSAAREAVYTNLGHGPYRFRVIARNPEGLWNSEGASLAFEIEPAFWQAAWFQFSVLIGAAAAALALYQYRMRMITRQLSLRFEERLVERTRIAQELHDTLLQGFLSASMQLHVAIDRLPPDSPERTALTKIVELMGQVIEEGRNALRGLRLSGGFDLEQAFSLVPQDLSTEEDVDFRVIVEGHPRPLHPLVRDEVYRIGREALVNAFSHSKAKKIEAELEYGSSELRVLIRDNGRGIDPEVLKRGREGHWGLPGMRERAERIGARLSLWSRAAAGTEVELSIPSELAFQSTPRNGRFRFFTDLYSRRTGGKND